MRHQTLGASVAERPSLRFSVGPIDFRCALNIPPVLISAYSSGLYLQLIASYCPSANRPPDGDLNNCADGSEVSVRRITPTQTLLWASARVVGGSLNRHGFSLSNDFFRTPACWRSDGHR